MKRLFTASHVPEDKKDTKLLNNFERKVIKRKKKEKGHFIQKYLEKLNAIGCCRG